MSPARKAAAGDAKKAIGYVRVSTEDQHLGPQAQALALARWCKANEVELLAVREDLGVSGAAELDKRPGMMAALDDIRETGAGVLLVAKRDRLARDTMLAAMVERLVEKAGATIISADGSGNGTGPEAEMMRGIINVFAQYERAVIRMRTKAALAVKAGQGKRVGEVALGKRATQDGRLVPDAEELQALARIEALHQEGMGVRRIAQALNAEGLKARGGKWHPTSVARYLSRKAAP
jgi:DNA invertase Pin-like site-specific DNA recombinase